VPWSKLSRAHSVHHSYPTLVNLASGWQAFDGDLALSALQHRDTHWLESRIVLCSMVWQAGGFGDEDDDEEDDDDEDGVEEEEFDELEEEDDEDEEEV